MRESHRRLIALIGKMRSEVKWLNEDLVDVDDDDDTMTEFPDNYTHYSITSVETVTRISNKVRECSKSQARCPKKVSFQGKYPE